MSTRNELCPDAIEALAKFLPHLVALDQACGDWYLATDTMENGEAGLAVTHRDGFIVGFFTTQDGIWHFVPEYSEL